jgi:hypothetical protein
MARLNKIWDQYLPEIESKLNYLYTKEQICFCLENIDPTQNNKYLRWIISSVLNDNLKLSECDMKTPEDSQINTILSDFSKYQKYFEISKRSLSSYKNLTEIKNSITYIKENNKPSGRIKKRLDQSNAYQETLFLEPLDLGITQIKNWAKDMKVISPLTEYASCWWGKGTKWCTSSTKSINMFNHYHHKSPIFIIVLSNGDKLQLWKYKNDNQFMNELDKPVNIKYIEQHWNELKEICLYFNNLKYIPLKYMNEDILINIINENPEDIEYIPFEYLTKNTIKYIKNNYPEEYKNLI